jgi:hypothetical protein
MLSIQKSTQKPLALALILVLIASLFTFAFFPKKAHSAAADWQKGVSMVSRWAEDFGSDSWKQSVRNAQAMGATHISLVVPYVQSDYSSSDIRANWNTPSDQRLGEAIDYIHSLGMKAVLKPHLEVSFNGWRALIQASDRDAWYTNYSAMLNKLGDIGAAHGVEEIVVGTELIGMASPYVNANNTARWSTMIDSLRARYSGILTYSANWGSGTNYTNEFEQIEFWNKLDYIGISAYFNHQTDNSVESIKSSWKSYDDNQISKLQAKYGKPILFTEIGYRSVDNAHTQPWNHELWGNYNAQEQVNSYEALFQYWNNKPYFAGILLWDWHSDPSYGGEGNTDYTPRNKPAENNIRQWFTQSPAPQSQPTPTPTPTPTPQPTPTPAPTGSFTASSGGPSNGETNTSSSFPITVTSTGQASNVIVDVEIYSGSSRAFQQFFEGQSISQASPGNYTISFTPTAAGTYTLKAGVFNNNWTTNYYWNNDMQTFVVTAPGQTPPPPPPPPEPTPEPTPQPTPTPTPEPSSYTTNIWWPTNGVSVNGLQPFKAMLEGKPVGEYEMYWQVDRDVLNQMQNSDVDYPHKEVLVDLTAWTWKGEGPYNLNFVSKDPTGRTIGEQSVDIYVR